MAIASTDPKNSEMKKKLLLKRKLKFVCRCGKEFLSLAEFLAHRGFLHPNALRHDPSEIE